MAEPDAESLVALPLIGLVAIVRDEEAVLPRFIESVKPLIDHWTIFDTGSTDRTLELIVDGLGEIPGYFLERPWRNFGENLTELLQEARDSAQWLLRLDADMTVEAHPDFKSWLESDPDQETDAWQVSILHSGMAHRLPLLVRGGLDWRYEGVTHEYLDPAGRKQRPVLGLTVTHHADGGTRPEKFRRDLSLLAKGVEEGDARSIFYAAEAHRFLEETAEAIVLYERRAGMEGFVEETWYAGYQAAKLRQDADALVQSWCERPWRYEPLRAAADIVRQREHDDVLFVEMT